jgi:hypothetical protein
MNIQAAHWGLLLCVRLGLLWHTVLGVRRHLCLDLVEAGIATRLLTVSVADLSGYRRVRGVSSICGWCMSLLVDVGS